MSSYQQKKFYENRLCELAQLGFVRRCDYEFDMCQPREALIEQCASPIECPVCDLGTWGLFLWFGCQSLRPGRACVFMILVSSRPGPIRDFKRCPLPRAAAAPRMFSQVVGSSHAQTY